MSGSIRAWTNPLQIAGMVGAIREETTCAVDFDADTGFGRMRVQITVWRLVHAIGAKSAET